MSEEKKIAALENELEALRQEYQNFAYMVSHDLSSPFRTIEGFASILAENNLGTLSEESNEHIAFILKGVTRGKAILAALLEYSRLNTQNSEAQECGGNRLVERALLRLSDLVKECKPQIHYNLPTVFGEKQHLVTLFYHLLRNALLYREQGKTLEVSITCETQGKMQVFTIQDNGMGMKSTFVDKAFEPMTRGVADKLVPGVGMGLAVVKKIIRQHGGELSLKSGLGKGSIITFSIPAIESN